MKKGRVFGLLLFFLLKSINSTINIPVSNPVEAEKPRVHWQGSDCLGAPRLDLPGVGLV